VRLKIRQIDLGAAMELHVEMCTDPSEFFDIRTDDPELDDYVMALLDEANSLMEQAREIGVGVREMQTAVSNLVAWRTRHLLLMPDGEAQFRYIAASLKAMRVGAGLTMAALAEKTGISKSIINHVENGRSASTLEVIAKWCDACGYELDIRFDPKGVRAEQRAVEGLVDKLPADGLGVMKTLAQTLVRTPKAKQQVAALLDLVNSKTEVARRVRRLLVALTSGGDEQKAAMAALPDVEVGVFSDHWGL
jgi:transcriptional regulator with XRE-family HTH domain